MIRDATFIVAVAWLGLVVVLALFADGIAPYASDAINLRARLAPPGTGDHLMGTDHLGRDMLSRLLDGLRLTLLIALVGTLIGAIVGTALGLLAAQAGGRFDDTIVSLIDAQAALPFLILALGALAIFGNSITLFLVVVGFQGWERYARLARGLALSAREAPYVEALRHLGASRWRIYALHILPNISSTLIVNLTLNFPETILLESGLSFVGLGIQPPLASLGSLLGQGRDYLMTNWWLPAFPGALIFLTALSVAVVGDRLRDRLDPTHFREHGPT